MPIQFIKQIRHLKIRHLPLQVWDHHLRFSFLSWKKLKVVHPFCKDMWELPDCITTGTGMSVETRWAGELHQSLVVLHQPQACSSQILKPPTEKVQSLWSGCKCGIWSSMPLTNVQWSTLSSFYMVKKSCRSKSMENYVTLVILTSWKGKCVTMVKYFPLLVTPKEWNENSKGNFLPHFSLAWKSLGVLNTIQKR